MKILALDPGPVQSAWVVYDVEADTPLAWGQERNENVLTKLIEPGLFGAERGLQGTISLLAVEYPHPRGQPLYYQLVDTIFWIGRFVQAWGKGWRAIDRKDVKMRVCGSSSAKDSNIRCGLIAKFNRGSLGGGKEPVIGTSKQPGPLFGFSGDMWAALGIAVTFTEFYHTQDLPPSDETNLTELLN